MSKKVAAVQMVSTDNVSGNLVAAGNLIAKAAGLGAELVLLPENFAVLDAGPLQQFGERHGDHQAMLQAFLSQQAKTYGITLVGGTIPLITRPLAAGQQQASLLNDGRVRPACLVYDSSGTNIARYDKIHLFDVTVDDKQAEYSESKRFEPGDQLVNLPTNCGKLGLSICYDLRFPELYRQLVAAGAEIITVPSAFTKVTGTAHWETLLRARAIETQTYVIAANQGGVHNDRRETFGHSMIIDPWGTILDQVEIGEGVAIAEIDLQRLVQIRRNMPLQAQRRL